jgi:hypothetical protein
MIKTLGNFLIEYATLCGLVLLCVLCFYVLYKSEMISQTLILLQTMKTNFAFDGKEPLTLATIFPAETKAFVQQGHDFVQTLLKWLPKF